MKTLRLLALLVAACGSSTSKAPTSPAPTPTPTPIPTPDPDSEVPTPESEVRNPAPNAPDAAMDDDTRGKILTHEAERDLSDGFLTDTAKDHPSAAARHLAIRSLGRVAGPEAVQHLRRIVDVGRKEDRFPAVEALALAGATEAADDIAAAYKKVASLEDVVTAVRALGRIGSGPRAQQMLLDAAKKKDPNVRAEAAFAFGYWTTRKLELDKFAVEGLVAMLADAEPLPRFAAAWALGRATPEQAKPAAPALRKLLTDADPEVRAMAVKALGKAGPEPADLLLAMNDADWRVRVEAVRALPADAGDDLKKDLVENIRTKPNAHVALEASAKLKTQLLEVADPSTYAADALRCADAAARVRAGGPSTPCSSAARGRTRRSTSRASSPRPSSAKGTASSTPRASSSRSW